MVLVEYFDAAPERAQSPYVGQIVLRPNASLSWRTAKYIIACLMLVSGAVALTLSSMGYWLILPFTLLELAVLGACFYACLRRSQTREVVSFSPSRVVLEVGRRQPEIRHDWQRFFTKVLIKPPAHPWYPQTVALRCREQEREIGSFLSAADKRELIDALRKMIAAADARVRTPDSS